VKNTDKTKMKNNTARLHNSPSNSCYGILTIELIFWKQNIPYLKEKTTSILENDERVHMLYDVPPTYTTLYAILNIDSACHES
jgi:hypothetical protein